MAGFVDQCFASVVNRGGSAFHKDLRSNLIDSQQRVSSYCVKGVHFGTDQAETVVGVAVDLATKGVSLMAANAARLHGWRCFEVLAYSWPVLDPFLAPSWPVLDPLLVCVEPPPLML